MTSAICSRVSAICVSRSDVLIAWVKPPIEVLGCGSNVSSWLGPPWSQTRIRALGVFEESGDLAIDSATLVQNEVAQAAAIGAQPSRSRRLGFELARMNFRYDSQADGSLDSTVMRVTVFKLSLVVVHHMLRSQVRVRNQRVGIDPSRLKSFHHTTNRRFWHHFWVLEELAWLGIQRK